MKVWAHVSLAELRAMDDGSLLETGWVTEMRIRWAARRAGAAGGTGGDGGAWLDGDAARAIACDAAIAPVVTGDIDPSALDDLVALCLQLRGHGAHCQPPPDPDPTAQPGPAPAGEPGHDGEPGQDGEASQDGQQGPGGLGQLTAMSREAIQQAIIGKITTLIALSIGA